MDRKYDLPAICLLFFSGILTAWLGIFGPANTTTLKDWQPLMASMLAIGGALIVYRGAKLAYTAAMAKVELDRELHAREAARITLGVCLRLEFSLRELSLQVRDQLVHLPAFDTDREAVVRIDYFDLTMDSKLDEAWANLDRFPRRLSQAISDIRGTYFDYKTMIRINPRGEWAYGFLKRETPETIQLRQILTTMERHCSC